MLFHYCGASLNETCSQCMQVHHTLQSIDCAKYTVQCVYWTPCVCLLQPGGINDEESTFSMAITTETTHGLTSSMAAAMGGTAWQPLNDSKSAFAICFFEFILDAINFPLFAGGVDNAVRYKHTSMYVCTHMHISCQYEARSGSPHK